MAFAQRFPKAELAKARGMNAVPKANWESGPVEVPTMEG